VLVAEREVVTNRHEVVVERRVESTRDVDLAPSGAPPRNGGPALHRIRTAVRASGSWSTVSASYTGEKPSVPMIQSRCKT